MSWEGGNPVRGCVWGVVTWQGEKGGRVVRWQVGKGGMVVR